VKFCRSDRPLNTRFVARAVALVVLASASLAGCALPPVQHGYVLSEEALSQVPVGSSREQVQLVLGSPSTTSSVAGDAYYYISQTQVESPIWGRSITDQHILAVYFDEKGNVKSMGNYGLKDGKVFDFIERRTRATGAELNLLSQMLQGVGRVNPLGNLN
jgi:outer membrane protein assembly factor BamE (lipoprotein component of BamABCDE complex)